MGGGAFEEFSRSRSAHAPFLQQAGQLDDGFGIEAADRLGSVAADE
jgi:hypothetical protein